jgi:hypothetical protein
MKKIILALVIVLVFSLAIAVPVAAAGGQVRGDNGQGAVNQQQVMDPPPFQP